MSARFWSTNHTEQLQMETLYKTCKDCEYVSGRADAETRLYASFLEMIRIGGGTPLPAYKAQIVFEAVEEGQ